MSSESEITITRKQLKEAVMKVVYLESRLCASQIAHGCHSRIWRELGGDPKAPKSKE